MRLPLTCTQDAYLDETTLESRLQLAAKHMVSRLSGSQRQMQPSGDVRQQSEGTMVSDESCQTAVAPSFLRGGPASDGMVRKWATSKPSASAFSL